MDKNDWAAVWAIFWMIVDLAFYFLTGVFIFGIWITRMSIQHVLNPMLGGWLDRNDGAVICTSSLAWMIVGAGIVHPILLDFEWITPQPHEMMSAWIISAITGAVFGVICGAVALLQWFEEVDHHTPKDFAEHLELPASHYQVEQKAKDEPEISSDEIESWFQSGSAKAAAVK